MTKHNSMRGPSRGPSRMDCVAASNEATGGHLARPLHRLKFSGKQLLALHAMKQGRPPHLLLS